MKSLINSDQAVTFLSAYSEQMLAFVLFSFFWRVDPRSDFLNTKHFILSEQSGRHDIGRFNTKEVAALKYNEAAAQV